MTSVLPRSPSQILFLALVAVLPLHTLFVRVEIAVKPWLVLVTAVAALDLWEKRRFPWSRRAGIGVLVFLAAALISWPGPGEGATFWRLWLALGAGGLLVLVTGRHASRIDDVLRIVFWSGAVMAATAFVLALVTNGVFGEAAVSEVNNLWLIERVNKSVYLSSGFIAVTNWHQDPGYAALWTNVWLALSIVGWGRGALGVPKWVPPIVIGGLGAASVFTYSRAGWLGLAVATVAGLVTLWRHDPAAFRKGVQAVAWGGLVAVLLIAFQVAVDPGGVGGDVVPALEFRLNNLLQLGSGEVGGIDPNLVVADNRIEVWKEYGSRFVANPFRGIGLGTGWRETGLQEPHELLVELFAETGIIGALGFVAMLLSLGRRGGPIAGAALVVVAVAALTQTVLFEPVLWFALGLWLAGSTTRVPAVEMAGVK